MKTLTHTDNLDRIFTVHWDDLQVQPIEYIDRSVFYKCTGYDDLGRQYYGISEFCCGEFEEISEVERISHMHHNRKPYQARALLKSIRYWQSVVQGRAEPKRPLSYYKNKLDYYTQTDIDYLINLSK